MADQIRRKDKESVSCRLLQKYMIGSDTIQELAAYLKEKGFEKKQKTIYGWADGNARPSPEIFLHICRFYKVDPYDLIEEYRKEDLEQGKIVLSEDEQWMIAYIRNHPDAGKALIAFLKADN